MQLAPAQSRFDYDAQSVLHTAIDEAAHLGLTLHPAQPTNEPKYQFDGLLTDVSGGLVGGWWSALVGY